VVVGCSSLPAVVKATPALAPLASSGVCPKVGKQ
jgi:hypothetical protein